MTTMHAAAAFPHPLGLAPDRPENLLQILHRLRNEAGDTIRRLRAEAEASASLLIDFLDATDGDADLEDGGDAEPSLGMLEAVGRGGFVVASENGLDLEVGEGDDEPSLGWPEGRESQQGSLYGTDDLEDEHDGSELEEDACAYFDQPAFLAMDAAKRAPRALGFDPRLLTSEYAAICEGDCMAPEINDGDRVLMDPKAVPAVGDIVNVCKWMFAVRPGTHQMLVKRLSHMSEMGVWLTMHKPAESFFLPWSAIACMHKVTGTLPPSHPTRKISSGEVLTFRALELRAL